VTVRALVSQHYGEPSRVGVMGSSLGGLISFHIAARHPGRYDFAASMSGTMGWGSIGLSSGNQNETMIERYAALGKQTTKLFLDSGGAGTCVDSDNDGIQDDALDGFDNYCENKQLEATLYNLGYVASQDVWHWHEPNAPHNEAAWAARVFRPLGIFAGL
jgi:pimeloyl-ACP methyl ester carboxylesterase